MTEQDPKDKPDDKSDADDAVTKLKALFNEVLDEREAKATEAREEAEKEKKTAEPKRTDDKPTFFQQLFGG